MRIAIITLPSGPNYGGLLQAYGTQEALRQLGVDSDLITYHLSYIDYSWYGKESLKIYYRLFKNIFSVKISNFLQLPPFLYAHRFKKFVNKHYVRTKLLSYNELKATSKNYDCWIIGSDQVWRRDNTRVSKAVFHFLDFLTEEERAKSFSYATSFGLDYWQGTPEETKACAALCQQLKAVSVREESGIDICKRDFDVSAIQMPDPTILLTAGDYSKIIDAEHLSTPQKPYIASYVLDNAPEISDSLRTVSLHFNRHLEQLHPHLTGIAPKHWLPKTVEQWLKDIRDADYMITDSFHGCVFAITFNIPFVCLGNQMRGGARFATLLKTFALEDRMVETRNAEEIIHTLNTPIDWQRVNTIRESERQRGISFLKKNLFP